MSLAANEPTRSRGSEPVLWLALLAGFLPVLGEFVRGFSTYVSPPSTLLAPVLIALCLWRGKAGQQEPRRIGVALIAAGLLLELTGLAARTFTVAWLGFPLAVVGMSLWLGRPSWQVAVLAFGLVPVPVSLHMGFSPRLEASQLAGACALWRALGLDVACAGSLAQLGESRLELGPDAAGWTLVAILAQLGWFTAVFQGAGTGRALRAALAFAAAALLVQPVAVAIAVGLLALGPDVARAWLFQGAWLACAAGVLLWSLRGSQGGPTGSLSAPPSRA